MKALLLRASARIAMGIVPAFCFDLAVWAQSQPCVQFTVVTRDTLGNEKQGLSAADVKWFQKTFTKKYPAICYAEPDESVRIVFYITATPDVYHGTRVVTHTAETPISGTVTNPNGLPSPVRGTAETTSSTTVPYTVNYSIYTLSIERKLDDGKVEVLHRFQQKGLYNTGIWVGGRGYYPVHAVIEDATKWIGAGGLTDPRQRTIP